jgi:hypothetical protein
MSSLTSAMGESPSDMHSLCGASSSDTAASSADAEARFVLALLAAAIAASSAVRSISAASSSTRTRSRCTSKIRAGLPEYVAAMRPLAPQSTPDGVIGENDCTSVSKSTLLDRLNAWRAESTRRTSNTRKRWSPPASTNWRASTGSNAT